METRYAWRLYLYLLLFHRPVYPEWWKTSYSRSAAFSVRDQFAGDQPLFPECPTFEAGSAGLKVKRYGPVVSHLRSFARDVGTVTSVVVMC